MTNRASLNVSMSMHNQTKQAPSGPITSGGSTTVMVMPTENLTETGPSEQHCEENYQHYLEHHHGQVQHAHHGHHHHHHHHHHGYHPAVGPSTPPSSDGFGYHHEVTSTTSTASSASGCRCSNRLLTGIVITILPIAITSTLICVFMMQKTNLHQYAIYSFVIFCAAFVFPFALFFFTVVLNKIYKFYKREFLQSTTGPSVVLPGESCDIESGPLPLPEAVPSSTSSGYHPNLSTGLGRVILAPTGEHHHQSPNGHAASLICYPAGRIYHPYYYQIEDGGTIVAFAPAAAPEGPPPPLIIEDSPPSYEMALLCPSVNSHSTYQGTMQVLLHKQSLESSKEKPTSSEPDISTHQGEEEEVEDEQSNSASDPSLGSSHEPAMQSDNSSTHLPTNISG